MKTISGVLMIGFALGMIAGLSQNDIGFVVFCGIFALISAVSYFSNNNKKEIYK